MGFLAARGESGFLSALPALISAGYGQLTDTPDYGTDSGAFGDRVAAAFVRQATMRFFCSSMFPVLMHEDPRTTPQSIRRLRKPSRVGGGARAGDAERQREPQCQRFHILGHLAASLLTLAYYPSKSRTTHVVMQTWGTSIAGAAGNNLFLEFVPDALNAWHNRKQHADSSGTQ